MILNIVNCIFPLSVDVTGESVGLDPKRDDALAQEISVSAVSLETSTLQEIVQKDFKELMKGKSSSLKYQAMYEGARVMVDVEKIVPLFEGPCGKKSCDEKNEVVEK